MKTILALIAIALMFSGQVIADEVELDWHGVDWSTTQSITKEEIAKPLDTAYVGGEDTNTTTIAICYQVFEPKEDITVYELSLCLAVLLDRSRVDLLPPKAARHLREVCQ